MSDELYEVVEHLAAEYEGEILNGESPERQVRAKRMRDTVHDAQARNAALEAALIGLLDRFRFSATMQPPFWYPRPASPATDKAVIAANSLLAHRTVEGSIGGGGVMDVYERLYELREAVKRVPFAQRKRWDADVQDIADQLTTVENRIDAALTKLDAVFAKQNPNL